MKILVLGDPIIDEYLFGHINRMSPEDSTIPVFDIEKKEVLTEQSMLLKYVEKSKTATVSRQSTQETKFVKTDGGIEEIKTIV